MRISNRNQVVEYDPYVDGNIALIRILANECNVYAEIVLNSGKVDTIDWNNMYQRSSYLKGVTAQTIIYDTRVVENGFKSLVKEILEKNVEKG